MDCAEFVELVTAFSEGALSAEDRQRTLDHVSLCEGCSRYLEQYRTTVGALAGLPSQDMESALRDRLLAGFRRPDR